MADNSKNISDDNMSILYDKLQLKHKLCLQRNNISFIVGGTKDLVFPLFKSYQEICSDQNLVKVNEEICSYFIIFSNQVTKSVDDLKNELLKFSYGNILNSDMQNIKVIVISPNTNKKESDQKQALDLKNGSESFAKNIRFISLSPNEDYSLD